MQIKPSPSAPSNVKRKLLVVVDDDVDLRHTLGDTLTDEGFEVKCAENGRIGLEILRGEIRQHRRPSAVLLDLMMPVMSGYEFRQEQQADPELAGIPVLVMSARWEAQSEVDSTEFIPKPIKLEKLLSIVHRLCETTGTW